MAYKEQYIVRAAEAAAEAAAERMRYTLREKQREMVVSFVQGNDSAAGPLQCMMDRCTDAGALTPTARHPGTPNRQKRYRYPTAGGLQSNL